MGTRKSRLPLGPSGRRAAGAMGAVLAVFGVLLLAPVPVAACRCFEPPSPTEALRDADAVFQGKVTEIRMVDGGSYSSFAVDRWWKGVLGDRAILRNGHSAMCGFEFAVGERYLVYAYGTTGDAWSTTSCTRTRELALASADLAELEGEPTFTPVPSAPPATTPPRFFPPRLLAVGAVLALLAGLFVARWAMARRRA